MKILALLLSFFAGLHHAGVSTANANPTVLLGEERLSETAYASLISGKKIGVLSHHASRDHQGQHVVDRLAAIPGTQLKMIFAPEHGYRSINDTLTPDSVDSVTGLPVYSLYGPRTAPTADMLSQLDAVVIDLQDVGLRYYTYPATMVYTMKACKAAGKKVIVLDRPNPLGGEVVEGAMLDSSLANGGLTTLAQIPTRHGMTLGELAIYFNDALNIHADLSVVPMSGWTREMGWDDAGVPWTPSSPALVSANQATYYAMFGTLEAAGKLAVGRGQDNSLAFQVFGAPWISESDQATLVDHLNALQLPNLKFETYSWTPDRAAFQGILCHGFHVTFTNSQTTKGFEPLMKVLEALYSQFGAQLNVDKMLPMLGANWVIQGIKGNAQVDSLSLQAQTESEAFLGFRSKALLYESSIRRDKNNGNHQSSP